MSCMSATMVEAILKLNTEERPVETGRKQNQLFLKNNTTQQLSRSLVYIVGDTGAQWLTGHSESVAI